MSLTILFDLDDTLLGNDIDIFLGAYLTALSKHLSQFPANEMINNLLAGTKKMIIKDTPANTLEETFDQRFYPALGVKKSDIAAQLDDFYTNIFPGLNGFTTYRPEAVTLVEACFQRGYQSVIATNPLFPRKAILHRLAWAGLPAEKYPFSLITSYETYHFAKPNPAFFAEVLARLGFPDQPVVCIGNSLEDDIIPAARLGMPVYWLSDGKSSLPDWVHPLSAQGSLSDALAWFDKVASLAPLCEFQLPDAFLPVLKAVPATLDTIARGLSQSAWETRPEPGEWAPNEIVCHLRDVEGEVNLPRVDKILTEETPFLAGEDTDAWATERDYLHQNGQTALKDFLIKRTDLFTRLNLISKSDWQKPARHAIFGPTNLQELASFITTHDRTHLRQFQAACSY